MNEDSRNTAVLALATEESFLLGRAIEAERPGREVLTMRVGTELYGVEVPSVREILRPRELTEIPRAPVFLVGIVSMRGLIVPVIDLRLRLRIAGTAQSRDTRIVVIDREGELFGLLVDEVRAVVRIAEDDIEPAAGLLGLGESGFLSGVGRIPEEGLTRDRVVILLELRAVVEFEVAR